jgi:hypothetical protein
MESVGMQIRRHARSNKDYKSRDKVDSAYNFFESINEHLFNNELPDVVVGFDTALKLKMGTYFHEADDIGVKYHCNMNPNLTEFDMFLCILHNSVHAQAEVYKKKGNWYHNKEFVKTLQQWGIDTADDGEIISLDPDVMEEVLKRIGRIDLLPELMNYDCHAPIPEPEVDPTEKPKKKHMSKKYICSCKTIIRCNVELFATCDICSGKFNLGE